MDNDLETSGPTSPSPPALPPSDLSREDREAARQLVVAHQGPALRQWWAEKRLAERHRVA